MLCHFLGNRWTQFDEILYFRALHKFVEPSQIHKDQRSKSGALNKSLIADSQAIQLVTDTWFVTKLLI
jgi:hypothetical protein